MSLVPFHRKTAQITGVCDARASLLDYLGQDSDPRRQHPFRCQCSPLSIRFQRQARSYGRPQLLLCSRAYPHLPDEKGIYHIWCGQVGFGQTEARESKA